MMSLPSKKVERMKFPIGYNQRAFEVNDPKGIEIVAEYQRGRSAKQLALENNVSFNAIRGLLVRAGVSIRKRTLQPEEQRIMKLIDSKSDSIIQKYKSGTSITQLAIENGVCHSVMRKFLVQSGIIFRYKGTYNIRLTTRVKECLDLATRGYVAGLVDGEGSISVWFDKKRNMTTVSVAIFNTDIAMLRFVESGFGGTVLGMSPSPMSTKPIYQWKIHSFIDVLTFLQQVEPYLITKKDRAKHAIEICKNKLSQCDFYSPKEEKMAESPSPTQGA